VVEGKQNVFELWRCWGYCHSDKSGDEVEHHALVSPIRTREVVIELTFWLLPTCLSVVGASWSYHTGMGSVLSRAEEL
jgi:hypothetical protein